VGKRGKPESAQFDLFVPVISDLPIRDQRETMERPFSACPNESGSPRSRSTGTTRGMSLTLADWLYKGILRRQGYRIWRSRLRR
jgi:hypothetical protein